GRQWLEARAAAGLACALVARATSTDLVAAEEPLARAEILAKEHGYSHVLARTALARAALLLRAGQEAEAHQSLIAAVRGLDAYIERPELPALRLALDCTGGAGDEGGASTGQVLPGEHALVAALGFTSGARYRVIDRERERLAGERELATERQSRDLIVEPERATITAERGARSDHGRPVACQLLARLIEGQGATVAAEELFRDVWGGREYHPLRHRNTVYVAVKRLRQTLRKLLGERDIIETAPGGWRIAGDVDAAVIRPL
ncbi:MAG: helix-turn-helix domain-containing protein, partial [Myxococcota bacterium]